MHIFGASLVFVCDESFSIIHNGGIAFEANKDRILEVGTYEELCALYPHAKAEFAHNSVLLPALINAHIHFEFGAHLAQFCYGDFGEWLDSLMSQRDSVLAHNDMESIITQGINEQLSAGVGSVGAISSYGGDMPFLARSPLRVVYFNEAIGSNPSAIDMLYGNLLERFYRAKELQNETCIPALALHSPYSLHPIMAQKIIEIAHKEHLPFSAHFLESPQEAQWLGDNSGYFKGFFQRLAGLANPSRFYTPQSFLDMLSPLQNQPLSLTHCLHISPAEVEHIETLKAAIITCPRSNRLLNNAFFPRHLIESAAIPLAIGTDGKSSNNNVNLLDELRVSLYAYEKANLNAFGKALILNATLHGAKALGLNNGILQAGKNVDFAIFAFKDSLYNEAQNHVNQAPLHFILHATKPTHLYVNAKAVI